MFEEIRNWLPRNDPTTTKIGPRAELPGEALPGTVVDSDALEPYY